jgi:hypothetical protein
MKRTFRDTRGAADSLQHGGRSQIAFLEATKGKTGNTYPRRDNLYSKRNRRKKDLNEDNKYWGGRRGGRNDGEGPKAVGMKGALESRRRHIELDSCSLTSCSLWLCIFYLTRS